MTARIVVPKGLRREGAGLYRRVVADLDAGLTFDALELERLHGAARLRDDLEAMRADVRERGLVVDSPKGPIPNPMILRIESAEKAIAVLLSRLKLVRPEPRTGHLSRAQRNRLRDMNARGYG
jgi:hypothetical protein